MPVHTSKLEEASRVFSMELDTDSMVAAGAVRPQTAYLSHVEADIRLARGLMVLLREKGWNVSIDWREESVFEKATPEIMDKIQTRIREADWFLFLATPQSLNSRWCSWELGFANGVRHFDSILVVPTKNDDGTPTGNDYVQIYRHIEVTSSQRFGAFRPSEEHGVLVGDLNVPVLRY